MCSKIQIIIHICGSFNLFIIVVSLIVVSIFWIVICGVAVTVLCVCVMTGRHLEGKQELTETADDGDKVDNNGETSIEKRPSTSLPLYYQRVS